VPTTSARTNPSPILYTGLGLVAVLFAHIFVREAGFAAGRGVRLAMTAAVIAAMVAFVVALASVARTQDEYHRQVHHEALAIAFPVSLVLVFAVGYLRGEGILAGRDPRDLWLLLLVPYAFGFLARSRKYQ
jgi:hypothetical protein